MVKLPISPIDRRIFEKLRAEHCVAKAKAAIERFSNDVDIFHGS